MNPFHEKRVLTYGTFDLFHSGHAEYLRQLAQLGDHLIIGLSTDRYAAEKGAPVTLPFETRRAILASCPVVDRVIVEDAFDQKRIDIVNCNVSVVAMEDRWSGVFDDLSDLAHVVYVPGIDGSHARPAPHSFPSHAHRRRA